MKRVCVFATLIIAAVTAGCGILNRPHQMNAAAAAQVEALLRDADAEMRAAVESERLAFSYPAGSQTAEMFNKAAKLHIQAALDKAYEAYNIEHDWAMTNWYIAECEAKMGNSDKAIEFAQRTMKLDPKMDDLLNIIGAEYTRKGLNAPDAATKKKCYQKAIDSYQTFIRNHPDYASVPYLESTIGYLNEEISKLK
jgi:tetratricopeptide (TPR) repeat protein